MHPDEWLAQYRATLDETKERADRASAELAEVGGTAESPDGQVWARVNGSGALVELRLTRGVRGMDPDELARTILDCARSAQREAAGATVRVMEQFIGDSAALDFVKGSLPHGYAGDGTDDPPRPSNRDDDDFGDRGYLR